MFLVIRINDVMATLYRDGWDLFSEKIIPSSYYAQLKDVLEKIMEEPMMGYNPNYYYAKGKQIEFTIMGAKMLYYLTQNEGESKAPANTVY